MLWHAPTRLLKRLSVYVCKRVCIYMDPTCFPCIPTLLLDDRSARASSPEASAELRVQDSSALVLSLLASGTVPGEEVWDRAHAPRAELRGSVPRAARAGTENRCLYLLFTTFKITHQENSFATFHAHHLQL